jgi:hypothetical protein
MYYTEKECLDALDCFALFAEYDKELRGYTKARDPFDRPWKTTREWLVRLLRQGYSIESYAEYCGYEIVTSRRPKTGYISFEDGAMIAADGFWVSTNEINGGTDNKRQVKFLERHIPIARPRRL